MPETPTVKVHSSTPFLDLFDAQVVASPEAVALTCNNEQLTYRELSQRANQLAHHLVDAGVVNGSLVGICMSRSLDMVVGILAVLKAGGAYVPLDPAYPKDRLSYILKDAQAGVVITQSQHLDLLSEQERTIICTDREGEQIAKQKASAPGVHVAPDQLAYVIYTSGSTGNPKGVMIPHSSLANFIRLVGSALEVTPTDVYLQTASIAYALSIRQLMIPLATGATLVLANSEQMRDPLMLFQLVKEKQITVMDMVPSFWRACVQRLGDLPENECKSLLDNSLRRIVSIGEPLSSDIPAEWHRRFGTRTKLVNIFGQTETTGVVATYSIPREAPVQVGIVPIGRSIPETKLYLLNADLQPVSAGEPGELFVSNPCLACGYLNQPELTAQKFIANPFDDGLSARLYRTGDLARERKDGNIEFVGRGDQQVKIRGQRLELGEVESALRAHPSVRDCAVVARGDHPDNKVLVAYIVSGAARLFDADLRDYVRNRLPEYMVPTTFVFLDTMPLTPNGKLDRLRLPEPAATPTRAACESIVEPRNPIEQSIANIWIDLLHLDRVGIQENFFDLGGHSLSVVQLFSRIEEQFGVRLPTTIILQAPTIARLAEKLQTGRTATEHHVLIPIQTAGSRLPFFCVHGVGGGVLGYRDLAREMDPEQPFYGLQALGLAHPEMSDLCIENMARRYVTAMQSVQPHGPYRIGGYCFGGVVAYEMARQLEEQGEKVSLLAIFEGYVPKFLVSQGSLTDRIRAFWKHIPSWMKDYASMSPEEIRYRVRSTLKKLWVKLQRRPELQRRARAEQILETDLRLVPDRNVELTHIHSRALHQYAPDRYRGTVTLFRARNRSFNEIVFGSLDQTMGWDELALGGVTIKLVDGFHRNIHLPPYLPSLASELNHCLNMESQGEPK